jgi:hypothetical protein
VEKCVYCESVYDLKDSNADKQKAFCSISCEEQYEELVKNTDGMVFDTAYEPIPKRTFNL